MALKTVFCVVCQKEVVKAQTLHVGNGQRACRFHAGVEERARMVQAQLDQEARDSRVPAPGTPPPVSVLNQREVQLLMISSKLGDDRFEKFSRSREVGEMV